MDKERYRVRIRFRKEGDLRLISHRDLVRAFERMFRRAQLQLRMSEGFHPKARMSFPSALSLGVAGLDETMDVELAKATAAVEVQQRLESQAPPGLAIVEVRELAPGEPKAQPIRMHYALNLPASRQESARQAVRAILAETRREVERAGRSKPVDVRGGIEALAVRDGELQMTLSVSRENSVRPREVLMVLGLDDLESSGVFLRRTAVELAS